MRPKPTTETGTREQTNLTAEDRPEAVGPAEPYEPPRLVVHDGDDFVRSLGPAQACSPAPF